MARRRITTTGFRKRETTGEFFLLSCGLNHWLATNICSSAELLLHFFVRLLSPDIRMCYHYGVSDLCTFRSCFRSQDGHRRTSRPLGSAQHNQIKHRSLADDPIPIHSHELHSRDMQSISRSRRYERARCSFTREKESHCILLRPFQ